MDELQATAGSCSRWTRFRCAHPAAARRRLLDRQRCGRTFRESPVSKGRGQLIRDPCRLRDVFRGRRIGLAAGPGEAVHRMDGFGTGKPASASFAFVLPQPCFSNSQRYDLIQCGRRLTPPRAGRGLRRQTRTRRRRRVSPPRNAVRTTGGQPERTPCHR